MSEAHNPRRAFVRAALAGLGALVMTDSTAGFFDKMLETRAPYPVTSSGLRFGRQIGVQRIYWIDNEHVLFPAHAMTTVQMPDGQEKISSTPIGLYIWDVKQNTYSRYADLEKGTWIFQYDHGNIAYSLDSDSHGNVVAMIGKMGEEKRVALKGGQGIYPELEPSMGPGRRYPRVEGKLTVIYSLLPGHGYIYVGQGDPAYPSKGDDHLKLFRPGSSQPIELPILVKETNAPAEFSYSDHLGKYVLLPGMSRNHQVGKSGPDWEPNEPHPVYLISPEGQVDIVEIPAGPWYPGAVFPTREGLFWVSNTTHGNSRNAGGWLLKDGKITKLFDQLVDGAGVSPDGCTIVYANNDFNPETTEYVQAIDLCAAAGK